MPLSDEPLAGVDSPPAAPVLVVSTHGARHFGSQLPRIDEGFLSLGARLAREGEVADLVYANDEPRWEEAIQFRATHCPNAKLVLNVLDLPEHSPTFEPGSLWPRLSQADSITAISPFVVSQVQRVFCQNADLIWNPAKPITCDERRAGKRAYPYRVLLVGRLRDPGKRAVLAIQSLIRAGFNENEVAVVGGEYPSWGTDLGVVSDATLNSLYNSVDFVMVCSGFGGLELPICEAMAGGALPIVCYDLPTFPDLGMPRRWGCHPSSYSIAHRLITLCNDKGLYQEERGIAEAIGDQMRVELSGAAVANRILSVYQRLTQPRSEGAPV